MSNDELSTVHKSVLMRKNHVISYAGIEANVFARYDHAWLTKEFMYVYTDNTRDAWQ